MERRDTRTAAARKRLEADAEMYRGEIEEITAKMASCAAEDEKKHLEKLLNESRRTLAKVLGDILHYEGTPRDSMADE